MHRRISIVARLASTPDRDWNDADSASARLLFTESISSLRFALATGTPHLDIERVIVDRAGSAAEFLELLSNVPQDFAGDLLLISEAERAYLSSLGRGGDRVLYSLQAHDVRFYLETHELVTGRVCERLAS
jgi:hypothetical protein